MSDENFQKHRERLSSYRDRIAAATTRSDEEVDRAWRKKVVRGLFSKLYDTGLPNIAIQAYHAGSDEAHKQAEAVDMVAKLRKSPYMFSIVYETVNDAHPLVVTSMWNQVWSGGSAEFIPAYSYVQTLWSQRGEDRADFLQKFQRAGLVVLGSVQNIRQDGARAEIESLMEGRMAEGRKTIVTVQKSAARALARHIGQGVAEALMASGNGVFAKPM